jgi:rRNA processing protein Krr1/Pno1
VNPTINQGIKSQHLIAALQQKAVQLHSEVVMKDAYILQLTDDLATALKDEKSNESALQIKANEMQADIIKMGERIRELEEENKRLQGEKEGTV